MSPTSRLYDALNDFLRQCDIQWQDARHLQTLCWMIIGMIGSQNVHLNGFGVYVRSRAQMAQSHQRRFRRWLSNRRINVASAHHALIGQALSNWQTQRLYLSLDTTVVWNCFCIVWVAVVYRGRTVPVAWKVVAQSSSTVRLWTIQRVLRQAQRLMPEGVAIVLLADRGFADGKLMKYLRENLGWHFRIRIKRSFQFQHQGQWRQVSSVQLQPGQAYFTPAVSVGRTKPYDNVYLAFAHDKLSSENWTIVSDEPTNLQTFAQYRLRFQVEESFLDLKSNGFNLEASRLRDKVALSQLCGVIALTMLFLVLQGVQVVASGKRRQVDAHWKRGMSYLKLGWNWIRLAITHQWKIHVYQFLSCSPDPQPAIASRRQHDDSLKREFTVLSRIPAS
ncbi:transposase [Thermoleptolyngbya sichuanensis A183]|uniref:Transposase n=1 Tax=Thermoleptolyngbya sichuanensis A183 TaxID=2737172 RepID=A0A6M8BA05_9CYAN|nr:MULTISPECIES: transposase [Thermoleptolyngbya]QKD80999.1 transposase [Thermoleptolyngbya sichuanensis A183]QKD81057.1 transposase [Thermoleptolyngbya sichuanensis A183]QKD81107.1 transposase [Thermoleptolyngbya sichuanensis A183]QKD83043.1 transposase [Thermoleptolyngbya sichuanensis A183]QKD83144.1 transposase [Thermoleptolyngbya sichuanensis A183]